MAKADGMALPFESTTSIRPELLEGIDYDGRPQLISYTTDEFSAVCPYSGLPDIARVEIRYIPQRKLVELKSLKYYFMSFRNVGIYQEDATSMIFDHLAGLLAPHFLRVYTRYNVRGGIDAECVIESGYEEDAVRKFVHQERR
ncbi:MAG: NADPH-dependent 7-cyano-7-deazaguanine reductase QueF [Acidobacteria bacterium]|nr:NADPH-dependent 7-cyano-7-deazaguanine reductase QueF [Acidobacteriota bacterium]